MNLGPEFKYVEHKESTAEVDPARTPIAAMLNKCGHGEVFFGPRVDAPGPLFVTEPDRDKKAADELIDPKSGARIDTKTGEIL